MARVAGIDLGTNSFLCLIADLSENQQIHAVSDEVEIVRLGQDVDKTKLLQPQALDRAKKTLRKFKESIDRHKPEKILAVATSAVRDASNREELIKICSDLNIPLQIISGEREAELTFRGAASSSLENKKQAVIDIGGGSTEVIFGDKAAISDKISIDIGALRITEMFFPHHPPTDEMLLKAKNYITEKVNLAFSSFGNPEAEVLLAVAGTPTELVSAKVGGYDPKKIDNYILTELELQEWLKRLSTLGVEDRVRLLRISPGRADIILAGVLILSEIVHRLGNKDCKVSTRGLRYGICLELGKENR